jgi:lipoprotein-anchoring transpeptidase ErfK/SrfK
MRSRHGWVLLALALLVLAPVPHATARMRGAPAGGSVFPAAGDLLGSQLVVRAAPTKSARAVRTLGQFRSDFRLRVLLAVRETTAQDGQRWLELSLPGRPNGGRGWVPATAVELHRVANRIVVHRGARRLEVRRISDGKLLLAAPVAVGKPGAETPLGHDFYVQWRFVPTDPFYGSYALETSAYSRLSDWPGGGVVGIHGTDEPQLIGDAVSHGCIRMLNRDVVKLRALARLGTPIDILR